MRIIYHVGTGTFWDANDEWYVMTVPDNMDTDEIESLADSLFLPDGTTDSQRIKRNVKCGTCGTQNMWTQVAYDEAVWL